MQTLVNTLHVTTGKHIGKLVNIGKFVAWKLVNMLPETDKHEFISHVSSVRLFGTAFLKSKMFLKQKKGLKKMFEANHFHLLMRRFLVLRSLL